MGVENVKRIPISLMGPVFDSGALLYFARVAVMAFLSNSNAMKWICASIHTIVPGHTVNR